MHGPLTEVMIDAKDVFLIEPTQQDIVEAPGRVEIAAERLFDYDAGPLAQPDFTSCSTTDPNSTGGIAR